MREERIARNEVLFKQLNEQIRKLQWREETLDAVCECGDERCFAHIAISTADYERLRSDNHRFAVVPGHEIPEVEAVVERREGFYIVEKPEELMNDAADRR